MTDRTHDFDDETAEALLSGHGRAEDPLTGVLVALRAEADRPVPAPSAALAELLANGAPEEDELGRRRRVGRTVLGVIVAGGTTLALSGVAAAHDALPGPAQDAVTSIVNDLTPFHIEPKKATPTPRPAPSDLPSPGRSGHDDHGRSGSSGEDGDGGPGDTGRSGRGESGGSGGGSDDHSAGSGQDDSGKSGSGKSGSDDSGSGKTGSDDSGSDDSGSDDSGSGSGGSGSGGSDDSGSGKSSGTSNQGGGGSDHGGGPGSDG
jgi:hypothetical protein